MIMKCDYVYPAGMMTALNWVPINEAKPVPNTMILVSTKTMRGIAEVNRAYMDEGGVFHGMGSMSEVTAWSPLPLPYGEIGNER